MSEVIVPNHIGYIVDGNRRWAKEHGLPSYEGHMAGYNTIQDITKATFEAGVKYITAYIFSTENWKRSAEEVERLMSLVLRLLTKDLHIFTENNIRLRFLGSLENVSEKIVSEIKKAEELTANNTAGTLSLCFNYGGQLEIVDAVKKIVANKIDPADIDEKMISDNLYGADIPPVDLVVRTSGERRLSNFMLWRVAYSELLFLDKKWPDMTADDVKAVIDDFSKRSRRYGGN